MIGVFDSGIGGLTVVREIHRQMPQESILYFADTAHVPYGPRPLDEIKSFAMSIIDFLIQKGATVILMGCNISSSVAFEEAQKFFPVPVFGLLHGAVEEAIACSKNQTIGLLATDGTVRAKAYEKILNEAAPSMKILSIPCPAFVPLVEEGKTDTEEAKEEARKAVEPLLKEGVRAVILGCTHYPFLRPALEEASRSMLTFVDPAPVAVKKLKEWLTKNNKLSKSNPTKPVMEFYASGNSNSLKTTGGAFLGKPIEKVKRVNLFNEQ